MEHFKKETVKQLTIILAFFFLTTFTGCGHSKTKSNFVKKNIDIETIDKIEINNTSEQIDSLQKDKKRLNYKQTEEFVSKWNNSKYLGPIKSAKKYIFKINFKDGTTRIISGNRHILKEGNDFGFDIGDSKIIERIWNELNVDHIKNIKSVFENFIQNDELMVSSVDIDLMKKSLKSLSALTTQDELELLINVWMYYNPTDFSDTPEIFRILKNSRPQSIVAIKKRIENNKVLDTEESTHYSNLKKLLKQLKNE